MTASGSKCFRLRDGESVDAKLDTDELVASSSSLSSSVDCNSWACKKEKKKRNQKWNQSHEPHENNNKENIHSKNNEYKVGEDMHTCAHCTQHTGWLHSKIVHSSLFAAVYMRVYSMRTLSLNTKKTVECGRMTEKKNVQHRKQTRNHGKWLKLVSTLRALNIKAIHTFFSSSRPKRLKAQKSKRKWDFEKNQYRKCTE